MQYLKSHDGEYISEDVYVSSQSIVTCTVYNLTLISLKRMHVWGDCKWHASPSRKILCSVLNGGKTSYTG